MTYLGIKIVRIKGAWADTFKVSWEETPKVQAGSVIIGDEESARAICKRVGIDFPERQPLGFYDILERINHE